jgi:hypothetical protein
VHQDRFGLIVCGVGYRDRTALLLRYTREEGIAHPAGGVFG